MPDPHTRMEPSAAPERRSLSTQVADSLRELIISNAFVQGQQLKQHEIAKRLGVSHIPVREAFQLLESEGLVTTVPYKGAVVTRLSAAEIDELFDIRIVLESELLKRAIGSMRPDSIARAREIVERMDSAPPRELGRLNWLLHAELYRSANRPTTLEFVQRIHDNLDRYVRIQLAISDRNRLRAHEEHISLIDLCEAGDKAAALRLLSAHIRSVRDDLRRFLERRDSQ